MRAVVFGGSGFIGSHLARDLQESGVDVVVADIVPSTVEGVRFEYCDVREPITIAHEVPFDLVYNLAAVHRTPGHHPYEYYATNVAGAQNVVDWCSDGGEQRLVFTSSIAVYGPSEELKSEDAQPTPNSDYGRSKLLAETTHRRWRAADPDHRFLAIVRPAVVFGPGEGGNFTRLASALARNRFVYFGRTDVVKSCGYVGDLVAAMRFVETIDEPEITFNFCYPHRSTIKDICEAFGHVAGYEQPKLFPPVLVNVTTNVLRLVNPGDKGVVSAARLKKLTVSTNIEPEVLVEHGFRWNTDLASALKEWSAATDGEFV